MTPDDARRLTTALKGRFGGNAEAEEVSPGRYRFAVVSPLFDGVPHLRRQDQIWLVVDAVLSREQVVDLSLVLAFAPDEVDMELSSYR